MTRVYCQDCGNINEDFACKSNPMVIDSAIYPEYYYYKCANKNAKNDCKEFIQMLSPNVILKNKVKKLFNFWPHKNKELNEL